MFRYFNKRDYLLLFLSVIFIILQVYLELKIPEYIAEITRLTQTEGSDISQILNQGAWMLLCALGSLIFAVAVGYCAATASASFQKNIRAAFYHQVESFSMTEIKKFSIPSLITRSTNDIRQVHFFLVMGIQMIVRAPITATIAISKIYAKGWEFSLITIIAVAVVLLTIITLITLVLPKFKIIQTLIDNINRITRENLTGIRVIRAYNAEKYQTKKFEKANTDLTNTNIFIQRAMGIFEPTVTTVMTGLTIAIYWVGAALINSANLQDKLTIFSDTVVFSNYAVQVVISFMVLTGVFIMYPRASVSMRRLNEVLKTKPSIVEGNINHDINPERGTVEFKNVSFKYPDAEDYVLQNISFKSTQGQTVAFIGSTGSGKSTLINLIPRFYDVTEGEILINGQNVKDLKKSFLMDKIGYISQDAVLFRGTIQHNLKFGQKAGQKPTKKQLGLATKISQSEEFIQKQKQGLKAKVSQAGKNFSGGQKQRLSIARAIARDPEIYIFDDSFSALDYKTDAKLRHELSKHTKHATKFIVAQRIGTIKEADQIIVLDNGRCVGSGTHQDLIKNCKVYQEIALSQLSQTELEAI